MRLFSIFIVLGLLSSAQAQIINSWVKSGSGDWQDQTAWSLGTRPAQNQTIMLTNQGWKAIAIGPATVGSFPQSLNVESVIVAGNTDSFNVLLLNYAGTAVPLRASNGLSIFSGGQVQNLYSGLIVQNGSLTVSNSQFIQEGGVVVTTNAWLRLDNSTYNLTNGLLQAGQVTLGLNTAASFVQDGGSANMASLRLGPLSCCGGGTSVYNLVNGWLYVSGTLNLESESATAVFNQYGGTNFAGTLELEPPYAGGPSYYNLYGGMLCANSVLVESPGLSSYFIQTGGSAFITNTLLLHGQNPHSDAAWPSSYQLFGGTLSVGSLDINGNDGYSVYTQSNGTARVGGNLYLDGRSHPGDLNLAGGTLACSNIYYSGSGDWITQTGGALIVSNLLSFGGTYTPFGYPSGSPPKYTFTGGTLSASNMELFAQWFIGSSAQAGRISNPGWFKLGFTTLHIGDADEHLGSFILATNAIDAYAPTVFTNSFIALDGTSSKLSFADSSGQVWDPGATLIINNWNGNPSGGGAEQLKFGTSASGLNAAQLAQIRFSNPAGFPAGNYSAKLLPTGELVPDAGTPVGGDIVNNWTNPASGRWDSSANWSLATLPASNQTVNITNAGYKAVNIDPATVGGFPSSLTVSNLSVSAPTNALSTLLLNYTGSGIPLKVRNNCIIGTNGTIANYYSSFEVDGSAGGSLGISGGQFVQEGGLTVATNVYIPEGSLNATNAAMTLGPVSMGTYFGDDAVEFNQSGGSIAAASVYLYRGRYNLQSGVLYALGGTSFAPGGSAVFNQYGGTNFGDVNIEGTYRLLAGLVRGTNVGSDYGFFCQGGGEVQASNLYLTGQSPYGPNYFLTNGVLRAGTLSVSRSTFEQFGGQAVLTNGLWLNGGEQVVPHTGIFVYPAYYAMQGGSLFCPSITVTQVPTYYTPGQLANFAQTGGTNTVGGDLSLNSTTYLLDATGLLQTTNSLIGSGAVFQHQNGTHNVAGVLSVSGTYQINGGNLSIGGLWMHGSLAIGNSNGTPTVSCFGLFDLGAGPVQPGMVQVQVGTHHLGSLRLTGNSRLSFGNGSATVNFDASSSIGWSNGVSFVISNWNNSGSKHIFFGNNVSALNGSQLAEITFSNPGGYPSGTYGARLLSTGELVPVLQPTLQPARYGSKLVLTWPGGFQLLSATNITGPYTPVSGATSPWTNSFSKPREFFKLQGL